MSRAGELLPLHSEWSHNRNYATQPMYLAKGQPEPAWYDGPFYCKPAYDELWVVDEENPFYCVLEEMEKLCDFD